MPPHSTHPQDKLAILFDMSTIFRFLLAHKPLDVTFGIYLIPSLPVQRPLIQNNLWLTLLSLLLQFFSVYLLTIFLSIAIWASSSLFDIFYRLSRLTFIDMIHSVLGTCCLIESMDTQSEPPTQWPIMDLNVNIMKHACYYWG